MVASIQALTNQDLALSSADDGKRYELFGGEIHVTSSPAKRHVCVSYRLASMLSDHIVQNDSGEVLSAPIDVNLTPSTSLFPIV